MGVFGKVQKGSASRFSSKGEILEPGIAPDVSNAQLETPPRPMAYSGLKSGPSFDIEYEPNTSLPLDMSNSALRNLSPFMIQVEPPLSYGVDPRTTKKDVAGIIAAGHSGAPSAFEASRNRIMADIPGGSNTSYGGSVESFISSGQLHRPQGSDKSHVKNLKGEGPTRVGTPAIADVRSAVDITMQLRALVNTPPLIMLINPQSLTMSYTKLQQYSDRTRFGFVFQAWGEEQPKLSISARCGAFVSGGRGVQWASRRDSSAWQNLAAALQFYRHNGYIYDTIGKSNANHFVGALSIHYDKWVYYGNMESFTYTYDEGNQLGGVVFEMEFTVNAMVDTSNQGVVVSPMMSPVPSPSDRRLKNHEKPVSGPNTVSVFGKDGDGNTAFFQGQKSWVDINGASPQKPQVLIPPTAFAVRGNDGFVPTTTTVVTPAHPGRLNPFRIRG